MAGKTVEIDSFGIGDITDSNSDAPPPKKPAGGDEGRRPESGVRELADQVARLNRDKDADRRRAEESERNRVAAENRATTERQRAERAEADADAARSGSADAQRSAIDNAIAANTATVAAAKKSLAALWAEGKFDEAAEVQGQIAEAAAEIAQLKAGKAALPAPDTTTGRVERQRAADDPKPGATDRPLSEDEKFNKYVGQFSTRSQEWLRAHPEAVTDAKTNHRLIAAHHEAEAEGLKGESDEYFDFIEQRLGYAEADPGDSDDPQPEPEPALRNRAPKPEARMDRTAKPRVAAPVRGSNGSRANGEGGKMRVHLTQGEIDNATDGTLVWNRDDPNGRWKQGDPIGIDEMARRKAAMTAEGRYKVTDA